MKRESLLVVLTLMLTMTFFACSDKNVPGKTEESSLPATARAIFQVKPSEAAQILREKGYYIPEWVDTSNQFECVYPKEVASEDEATQESARKKMWIELYCGKLESTVIEEVWAEQHNPSAEEAFSAFNLWLSYLSKKISQPSLHVVYIDKDDETFTFAEGTLFDEYKAIRLEMYEKAYAEGKISKENLDAAKKRFSVTKSDLQKQLEYLSIDKEFTYIDSYIELTNKIQNLGVWTNSTFNNYKTSDGNVMLEHRLQYMNVESTISDLLGIIE